MLRQRRVEPIMGLKSLRITQSVETECLGEQLFSFLCLLKMRKDRVLCCVMGWGVAYSKRFRDIKKDLCRQKILYMHLNVL